VRRVGLAAAFAGLALAGAFAAAVVAGPLPHLALTTSTGTTSAPGTTTATTARARTATAAVVTTALKRKPRAKPRRKPRPRTAKIARGVTVGGIRVGGRTRATAEARIRRGLGRALQLRAGNLRTWVEPSALGFHPYVHAAVTRALKAVPGAHVRLFVVVRAQAVRAYVRGLAERFHRRPLDSQLVLRGVEPFVSKGASGREIAREAAVRAIVFSLAHNQRRPVRLTVRRIPQSVSRASIGPVIVIRRGSNQLYLYEGMRLARRFDVATGQSAYPSPLGRWEIAVMWRDPWWYPPNSPWAKGLSPVPPGPGNPLGTRWMGLTAPGVGIHGTPNAASIGYSASHGCIRMRIPEAEWLFEHVDIGTTVFIVSA
jgi:lipoprotein-anchoring transpeptidase ErfK/SrfK